MSGPRKATSGDQHDDRDFPRDQSWRGEEDVASGDAREARLTYTLAEIAVCMRDASALVAMGKQRFDDDWLTRRAARDILTELSESVGRLPDRFKLEHPEVPWRAISGMRNRVVHAAENTDLDLVWNVLASDLPSIGLRLDM